MAKLTKTILTTYIPADPGDPGSAGTAPSPGYWVKNCYTSTGQGCITQLIPVYGPIPNPDISSLSPSQVYDPNLVNGSLVIGFGTQVIGYQYMTTCAEPETTCTSVYVPPSAGTSAVPARPPSPAQVIQNFQEGWNSSAQSIVGLLPGKAAQFKIQNGARGVLVGFATEPWVPKVNTLEFGIMFADGTAKVYENGTFGASLGSFARVQEFIVGRTLDNYIVYMNKTDGATVARRRNPAPASVPVHVFSMLYYGGDTVLI